MSTRRQTPFILKKLNELPPELKHPSVAVKKVGTDSSIISNEDIYGDNSLNDKISMTSLTWRWYFSRYGRGDTRNKAENNYQEITMELAHTFLASWWVSYSIWQKICGEHRPRMTDRMILLYLNSWSQSYKGNDMNCCCVEKSSESRHRTWY